MLGYDQKEIGNALQFVFKNKIVKREELFITSKLWNSDHSAERVQPAIEKSLNDLQLEYLDLYLMHWPIAFKPGREQARSVNDLASLDEIPIETTWEEIAKLKLPDLNTTDMDAAFRIIAGTARSMGVVVGD